MKAYEDMTKTELQKTAAIYKVEDKVLARAKEEAIEAKKPVPKVPTNDTYIAVLNEHAEANPIEDEESEVGNSVSSSGENLEEIQKRHMQTKVRVTITDHDTNTSTEEELEDRVISIRYGNKRGRFTDHIPVHGNPTHVRQAALDALKNVKATVNKAKSSSVRERFKIAEAPPVTQEELDAEAAYKESGTKR